MSNIDAPESAQEVLGRIRATLIVLAILSLIAATVSFISGVAWRSLSGMYAMDMFSWMQKAGVINPDKLAEFQGGKYANDALGVVDEIYREPARWAFRLAAFWGLGFLAVSVASGMLAYSVSTAIGASISSVVRHSPVHGDERSSKKDEPG